MSTEDDDIVDLTHENANQRARGATIVASPSPKWPWILAALILVAALVVGGFFVLGGEVDVDPGDIDVDVDITTPDVDLDAPDASLPFIDE